MPLLQLVYKLDREHHSRQFESDAYGDDVVAGIDSWSSRLLVVEIDVESQDNQHTAVEDAVKAVEDLQRKSFQESPM